MWKINIICFFQRNTLENKFLIDIIIRVIFHISWLVIEEYIIIINSHYYNPVLTYRCKMRMKLYKSFQTFNFNDNSNIIFLLNCLFLEWKYPTNIHNFFCIARSILLRDLFYAWAMVCRINFSIAIRQFLYILQKPKGIRDEQWRKIYYYRQQKFIIIIFYYKNPL